MTPQRIQRKRTKGWRMPAGAVYVGRPTKWGNPFRVERVFGVRFNCNGLRLPAWRVCGPDFERSHLTKSEAVGLAVVKYRQSLRFNTRIGIALAAKELLRGHDLACWCPLDRPCHADVLLEIATGVEGSR